MIVDSRNMNQEAFIVNSEYMLEIYRKNVFLFTIKAKSKCDYIILIFNECYNTLDLSIKIHVCVMFLIKPVIEDTNVIYPTCMFLFPKQY